MLSFQNLVVYSNIVICSSVRKKRTAHFGNKRGNL
ncbi:hypothetical protein BVRB_7g172320 [Beta vulgaris subsp. vulgaris]|nr:hypothetical protein BVRB_7g172320 [Beta vulgaris subsp. vulgaris]